MKRFSTLCFFTAASCAALAGPRNFLTKPDIHGDLVVFTAEGDLWLGSITDHTARRITSDPGVETNAHFSPDGTMIAFTGNYDGGTDVYVMPVSGDSPKRLTFDPKGADVLGWSPHGNSILFRSRRNSPVGGVRHIFRISKDGGVPVQLPVPQGEFASISSTGQLAYVPVSNEWANWFRYQAGRADDIWLADLKGGFKRLTDYPGVDTTPVWVGKDIYFTSERSGVSNLYRLDPNSKAVSSATKFTDTPVRYPSSDGEKVVYQHGSGLGVYDPATKTAADVDFVLSSDRLRDRETRFRLTSSLGDAALGPTGKRVALAARGQIVSIATEHGDMRMIEKHDATRAQHPIWSPDGKKIAFISDRSGENEIWVTSSEGAGEPTQLTHGLKGNALNLVWSPDGGHLSLMDREARLLMIDAKSGDIKLIDQAPFVGSYDSITAAITFSPDGKYVAFSRPEPGWTSSVWIADVDGTKKLQLNLSGINAQAPDFDVTGKFLIYLSDTQLNPTGQSYTNKYGFDNSTRVYMVALSAATESPFLPKDDEEGAAAVPPANPLSTVDWEGLSGRSIEVPMPAGRYSAVFSAPGKLILQNQSETPGWGGSGLNIQEVLSFDLDKKTLTRVMGGAVVGERSKDGKKLLVRSGAGISVIDSPAGPVAPATGVVDLTPYTLTVVPQQEWKQIYEESWRIARDFFYDPNMHGVDWNAVHAKYAAMLPMIGDRSDLTRLLKDMVSELNSGHAYVGGPGFSANLVPMAFLGADYEPSGSDIGVKITKIYRGDGFAGNRSPLSEPGVKVKEGDYIVAIAGQPVKSDKEIQSYLVGLTGQTVSIMVNDKPSLEGAHTIRVRPLGSEDSMRYADWVVGRADYVTKNGGANFGYLHVPDMGATGLVSFTKGQGPNIDKTAMIYDVRYNGGGSISSLLLDNIAITPQAWWKPRYGGYWTRESWANIGYKAAICNEFNFSDGELFIDIWKKMKIGPVIGQRTGGGEVGSGGGYTMVDGGFLYIPNYGGFADGHWLVEGVGALPDIEVLQDPVAVMAGRDPQLDEAIKVLKDKLSKNPIVPPVHPPFPNKAIKQG